MKKRISFTKYTKKMKHLILILEFLVEDKE